MANASRNAQLCKFTTPRRICGSQIPTESLLTEPLVLSIVPSTYLKIMALVSELARRTKWLKMANAFNATVHARRPAQVMASCTRGTSTNTKVARSSRDLWRFLIRPLPATSKCIQISHSVPASSKFIRIVWKCFRH